MIKDETSCSAATTIAATSLLPPAGLDRYRRQVRESAAGVGSRGRNLCVDSDFASALAREMRELRVSAVTSGEVAAVCDYLEGRRRFWEHMGRGAFTLSGCRQSLVVQLLWIGVVDQALASHSGGQSSKLCIPLRPAFWLGDAYLLINVYGG